MVILADCCSEQCCNNLSVRPLYHYAASKLQIYTDIHAVMCTYCFVQPAPFYCFLDLLSRLVHFKACIEFPYRCHLDCRGRGCAAGPGAARALCWAPPNVLTSCSAHSSGQESSAWYTMHWLCAPRPHWRMMIRIQHSTERPKPRQWVYQKGVVIADGKRWTVTMRAAGIRKIQFFCTDSKVFRHHMHPICFSKQLCGGPTLDLGALTVDRPSRAMIEIRPEANARDRPGSKTCYLVAVVPPPLHLPLSLCLSFPALAPRMPSGQLPGHCGRLA